MLTFRFGSYEVQVFTVSQAKGDRVRVWKVLRDGNVRTTYRVW